MATVTIDLEDFTTLAGYAENYGISIDQYRVVRDFLEGLERTNSITRYFLYVRWRDRARPVFENRDDWPPTMTTTLARYTSPWTYEDVIAAVAAYTSNYFSIQVTEDRTGTVGWTDLDTHFGR